MLVVFLLFLLLLLVCLGRLRRMLRLQPQRKQDVAAREAEALGAARSLLLLPLRLLEVGRHRLRDSVGEMGRVGESGDASGPRQASLKPLQWSGGLKSERSRCRALAAWSRRQDWQRGKVVVRRCGSRALAAWSGLRD